MHVKKLLYYVVGAMAAILATNASAQVTTSSPGAQPNPNGPGIDFQNAKPLPLPQAGQAAPTGLDALRNAVTPGQVFGSPGFSPGGAGTGEKNPVQLAPATKSLELAPKYGVTPEEFGTSNLVYTTSRANAYGNFTADYYPFRAAGKLFFQIGHSELPLFRIPYSTRCCRNGGALRNQIWWALERILP